MSDLSVKSEDIPGAYQGLAVVDMLNAKYGLSLTGDDISALEQKVPGMETDFRTAPR